MSVTSSSRPDDPPRHGLTVTDVERMVDAGLLMEDDRVELINGELVWTSAKGNRHEGIKAELPRRWFRLIPDDMGLIPETTLRLAADTYLEPDICIWPRAAGIKGLTGQSVLLVVEIAGSSLGYDLGRKARLYARFGIRELWVLDAVRMEVHVHRDPAPDGYRSVRVSSPQEAVIPTFAPPVFAITTAELDLSGWTEGDDDAGAEA